MSKFYNDIKARSAKLIKTLCKRSNYSRGNLNEEKFRPFRKNIQIILQDPFASLSPRLTIQDIISEGLEVHYKEKSKKEIIDLTKQIIIDVGLDYSMLSRYPHEFSGGQRQRIGIARSLAVKPEILIADEPVSALDVSIQAQILELLDQIRDQMNLAMIFITHDLRVAAQVCDRVAVMRQGEVVETGSTSELFSSPKHDYTQALLAAVPGKTWQEGILAN